MESAHITDMDGNRKVVFGFAHEHTLGEEIHSHLFGEDSKQYLLPDIFIGDKHFHEIIEWTERNNESHSCTTS